VKDWIVDDGSDFKWRILDTLLEFSTNSDMQIDPLDTTMLETSNSRDSEKLPVVVDTPISQCGNESESSKLTSLDDHDIAASPGNSSQINVFDVELTNTRTRKKSSRVADSEEDELEEEDEIDWKADEEILPVSSTRNSSRKNKDFPNLSSNGRIGSGPAQSVTSDVSIPTSAKKERKKPVGKKKKERELPVMGFEELSNRMEKGFSKLCADDKVQLLNYMLECCLIESERFRNFRDQSFEKLSALTKEKRECIRDRKIMF
jgi:hypothetical protein